MREGQRYGLDYNMLPTILTDGSFGVLKLRVEIFFKVSSLLFGNKCFNLCGLDFSYPAEKFPRGRGTMENSNNTPPTTLSVVS